MKKTIAILLFISVLFVHVSKSSAGVNNVKEAEAYYADIIEPVDIAAYTSIQKRPGQDSTFSLCVAISGGGSRAANFAMGVLLGLEEIAYGRTKSNLLYEIDYFSTASAGGFAAGAYIASAYDHLEKQNGSLDGYALRKMWGPLGRELLNHDAGTKKKSTLKRGLEIGYHGKVVKDLLGIQDRSEFEQNIDKLILGASGRKKSIILGDIFKKSPEIPKLPYIFANAMERHTQTIFPVTPEILEKNCQDIGDSEEFFLSKALSISAGFPHVISPVMFNGRTERYTKIELSDGGEMDNTGFATANSILNQEKKLDERIKKQMLIVLDARNTEDQWYKVLSHDFHNRYKIYEKYSRAICERQGIKLIKMNLDALTVDDLKAYNIVDFLKRIYYPRETTWTDKRIKNAYQEAIDDPTHLNISEKKQDLLVEIGRAMVKINRDQMINFMQNDEEKK